MILYETSLFLEFSLRVSRACLGKIIIDSHHERETRRRFSHLCDGDVIVVPHAARRRRSSSSCCCCCCCCCCCRRPPQSTEAVALLAFERIIRAAQFLSLDLMFVLSVSWQYQRLQTSELPLARDFLSKLVFAPDSLPRDPSSSARPVNFDADRNSSPTPRWLDCPELVVVKAAATFGRTTPPPKKGRQQAPIFLLL